MTTHWSFLAWKIPWREESGGLQSMGSDSTKELDTTKQQRQIKLYLIRRFSVHTVSSVVQPCLTLCNPMTVARLASLSITSSWSLLKLMSIELVMPSNHLILCHPLSCLQSFPASGSVPMTQFFASSGPKYWSFSFNISPSNEY